MLYQNVNGLRSKLSTLKCMTPLCPYDVIIFCETNLDSDISDEELGCSVFNLYRRDRNEESSSKLSGGGVLIGVNKELKSWLIPVSVTHIECLFVGICCLEYCFVLGGVYIPPNYPPDKYAAFCNACEEAFTKHSSHREMIVVGDFNLPNTNWLNMELNKGVITSCSQHIFDLSAALNLKQCNSVLNERGVTLDLVLSSIHSVSVQPVVDVILHEDRHHPALEINIDSTPLNKMRNGR